MDVAIAGSSGLIGTALTETLQADGHRVIRLVRDQSKAGPLDLVWDPDAGEIDSKGLDGVDAVVNLCGRSIGTRRWTSSEKQALVDSRIGPTDLLARTLAALPHRPRALLNASGIGFYGDGGDHELTESSPQGDGFLADLCGSWEAATSPAADAGIRVVHLRTGLVLSGRGGFLQRPVQLFRFGLGGRIGSGDQYWSWVSMADEVSAIQFLLDRDITGPVNLTSQQPVTNAEFTRTLASVLRRPAFLAVPRFAGRLALGEEMADELLYAGQRVLPKVLEAAGYPFRHLHLENALRDALDR